MYQLKVREHFDAAHQLDGYKGKCHELHGHRWEVIVTLEGDTLDDINMLIDFKIVKDTLKNGFDTYLDHHYLNETLKVGNPTAEYVAEWLFVYLQRTFGSLNIVSVEVFESPDCSVTYSEVENEC